MNALALPEGRQGRILAIGVTMLGLALLWLAIVSPLLGWYQARAAQLAQLQALAAHMQALTLEIPQLREAVATATPSSPEQQLLLAGNTDAIAGANLQSALQNLATQAGTSLNSAEMLPVQAQGPLRRIGIQVSVTATWPVLVALLQAIGTARPRMIVSQLNVISGSAGDDSGGPGQPVDANLAVSAFSAGAP